MMYVVSMLIDSLSILKVLVYKQFDQNQYVTNIILEKPH
jgi:hypothetical protein